MVVVVGGGVDGIVDAVTAAVVAAAGVVEAIDVVGDAVVVKFIISIGKKSV